MNETWYFNVVERALDTYGSDAQILKTAEECSELIAEIIRWSQRQYQKDNGQSAYMGIIEELADVIIMSEQLILAFGKETIFAKVEQKLRRLEKRLDGKDYD